MRSLVQVRAAVRHPDGHVACPGPCWTTYGGNQPWGCGRVDPVCPHLLKIRIAAADYMENPAIAVVGLGSRVGGWFNAGLRVQPESVFDSCTETWVTLDAWLRQDLTGVWTEGPYLFPESDTSCWGDFCINVDVWRAFTDGLWSGELSLAVHADAEAVGDFYNGGLCDGVWGPVQAFLGLDAHPTYVTGFPPWGPGPCRAIRAWKAVSNRYAPKVAYTAPWEMPQLATVTVREDGTWDLG
jgi:hypothetical protein